MTRPSLVQLAVSGVSIISVSALVVMAVSTSGALRELLHLNGASRAYHDVLRKPLMKAVFGTDLDLPWTNVLLDAALLWLSLFAIINVFVYRHEKQLLWGHIRQNYCARATARASPACTAIKWLAALLATPWACVRIASAAIGSKHTLFTSWYITLSPNDMISHLKTIGYGVAGVIALLALIRRLGVV